MIPDIKLTEEGKKHDFDTFREIFESQFKIRDKNERIKIMKEVYQKLTGKKVGHSGIHKKARKADSKKDRERDFEDNQEERGYSPGSEYRESTI